MNNRLEVDRGEVIMRLKQQSNFSPRKLPSGSCLAYIEIVLCLFIKKIVKWLLADILIFFFFFYCFAKLSDNAVKRQMKQRLDKALLSVCKNTMS